ncbi:hypothetical protein CVN56_31220 [Rhodococcus sp. AQ5-07]|nr:hypothetical protein CVN56_31220 [Rhodococcus sp. AQ5-07]
MAAEPPPPVSMQAPTDRLNLVEAQFEAICIWDEPKRRRLPPRQLAFDHLLLTKWQKQTRVTSGAYG